MKRRTIRNALLAGLVGLAGLESGLGSAHAGPPSGLRNDPFSRPQPAKGPDGDGAAAAATVLPWQPELHGLMEAGDASAANVGGRLVGIGESVDGWRLLRVDDGKAIFAQGARRTTLTMRNAGSP